jgi:molybdopterin molybdotransferase
VDLGVAGDDRSILREKVQQGLEADVLVLSGGVSMGQHDYVPEVLTEAGVETVFHKVAIKPGKPTLFGIGAGGQAVFGLPGNPVSCLVCFIVFVRAAIEALQGLGVRVRRTLEAVVTEGIRATGDRQEYLPATLKQTEPGHWEVTPIRSQGSGDPFGAGLANGFIVRPAEDSACEPGQRVLVLPLDL